MNKKKPTLKKIEDLTKGFWKLEIRDSEDVIKKIERDYEIDDKDMAYICQILKVLNKSIVPKKTDEKEKFIETSFFESSGEIFEQVAGGYFIDWRGDRYDELFDDGENKLIPIFGGELEKGVVILPEKIEEYGDIKILISEIKEFIKKYYDCDEKIITFSAWYVLLTWVYDRLSTINYLRAMGDFGTGKSRFLDTIGRICYKPITGSGASSMAALKRMVEKWRGTVLTDEGDFKDDDEKNDLVKFYNLGFEKNRSIYQCDKNDPNKIDFFNPFCPKLITTRKQFKDQALESRCLTHITKTTISEKIPIMLPTKFFEEQMTLRNKLLKFRFDYYFKIDVDKIIDIDLGNIEPRLKQSTLSYSSLFSNIPEVLEEFLDFLKKYQEELIENRSTSFEGIIINTFYDLINAGEENITSGMIADKIKENDETFKINPRTIGLRLKSLGIETNNIRFNGKRGRVIVIDISIERLFKKYIPNYEGGTLERLEHIHGTASYNVPYNAFNHLVVEKSDGKLEEKIKVEHNAQDNNSDVLHVPQIKSEDISVVIKNLKSLQKYLKPVPFNDLVKSIDNEITVKKVERVIKHLKKFGDLIEPKPKMYELM